MTPTQAANKVELCSPSQVMQLNANTPYVIGVKSDDGSSYSGNLESLINTINSFDQEDEDEFCVKATGNWLKKKLGKNPPCQ